MRKTIPALLAGLVLGAALGLSMPSASADDETSSISDLLFARAEGMIWAMHNVMVSLAVDTERSAIEIATANDRIAALERRIVALEQAKAAN